MKKSKPKDPPYWKCKECDLIMAWPERWGHPGEFEEGGECPYCGAMAWERLPDSEDATGGSARSGGNT